MKLSCLPVSYFGEIISGTMSVSEWAREAAALGLDAVDLSILFLRERTTPYLRKVRQEIENAGVRVAMVTTYPDHTHPSAPERKRQVKILKEDMAAAAAVGAKMIRVTAGQAHPGVGREEGISWSVTGLTAALCTAEQMGLQVVFENHSKPGIWQYPDFSHPTDIFLSIVSDMESSGLRVNFDTANTLAYGDDPCPVLTQVVKLLSCVHVSDIGRKGTLEPVVIGTGIVPLQDLFAILRKSGYDGWISIEEASKTGRDGIEAAIRFVRRVWAATEFKPRRNQG